MNHFIVNLHGASEHDKRGSMAHPSQRILVLNEGIGQPKARSPTEASILQMQSVKESITYELDTISVNIVVQGCVNPGDTL